MDKIYIKDLEVYAFHGVNAEEKTMGQKFLISLDLSLDLREAGKQDDLDKTVNYAELCYEVERVFIAQKHNLIEKCAEEVTEHILVRYPLIREVKVRIKKPWAPIGKPVDFAAVEITRGWHRAYLGIGSNMGDKEGNLNNALSRIADSTTRVTKVSGFYETKPVGYLDQDDFVNCAAEIETLLNPAELMNTLLKIEQELKRERVIRWGPRTIDLDILLYDDLITYSGEITIPHPRMHERLFVLEPLSEIAPYILHPILKKRMIELKDELLNLSNK